MRAEISTAGMLSFALPSCFRHSSSVIVHPLSSRRSAHFCCRPAQQIERIEHVPRLIVEL